MKEVDLGSKKALLVKENGKFSAIGNKCTHYGAPLIKGHLHNGVVRCPWHGACFNTCTGDIEDFPGLDSVPVYEVCFLCICCSFPPLPHILLLASDTQNSHRNAY